MKVSRSKTEYMCVNEREGSGTVRLQGEEVKKVQEFKYLGSTVQSNGECGKEVKKRVQAGWNGWRKVSGVLCDQKISARIKGKVYRTVVRPAMLYGLETVSLRKRQESELEVAELKMLRFSLGVTRLDRIRNEYIRGTAHVGRLGDKVREARLRWFGHVQRREKDRTVQHGLKQQSTRPTLRSGRNLAAVSRRASSSRSDITRCHFRKHRHRFFCTAEVFGKPSWDSSVGEELCRLQQGKLTVPKYALQFRTLAAKSGWNEQALLAAYHQGLNPQVRLHLAAYEAAIGLERLIQLSIRVAARMQSCVDEPQDQSSHNTWRDRPATVSPPEPAPEPMNLGTSHLTPAERQRRLTQNLCLYCGAPGHAIPTCPIRPPHPMWLPSSILGQRAISSRAPSAARAPDQGHGDLVPDTVHHRKTHKPPAGQP
ncbi:hypothetical protein QTP70_006919 [Hemibagrus guttatus]|uniref:CCHC-type domain-containing protein n=1 Tax=Hemibagrus guttatus TaxID=175788 RepID=A0AAE0RJH9_9TELE|nr:hypothetical protein QTP70_006919 [Hemibagrus guttatus]